MTERQRTQDSTRLIALGALAAGIIVLAVTWMVSGSSYTIHARFLNAGRLVSGGEVQVAGRTIGSIANIGLTPGGEADVKLAISDTRVVPLHAGTRAMIRAFSQGSVDGNVVVLTPGPRNAPALHSGAVLPASQTSGIVDIDALLDSFGPAQRANLDALIANSRGIYAGSGARYFNRMLGELDPALGALDGATSSLALDRGALGEFVRTASEAATAVASRSPDLTAAVTHTARALGAIATHRHALADLLSRLPPVLIQGRGTLARARVALTALRPALRDLVPVAQPLRDLLTQVGLTLPAAGPVVAQLRGQLPALNHSLAGLAPLKQPAVSALDTLGAAMKQLSPIAQGLRYYGADVVIGSLAQTFGSIDAPYGAYGHYAKANFVESYQTLLAGPLSTILSAHPLLPGIFNVRTGLTRRCPGGAVPPAPDGSSPWSLGPKWCSAAHDVPLSVNFP